jgi:glutamate dehydrogenase
VAQVYHQLCEHYSVDDLLTQISGLPRSDRWQALARASLRYDLYAALDSLTSAVLAGTGQGEPAERIAGWHGQNPAGVARAQQTLAEVAALERSDLAAISVALRSLRAVVRAGS